MSSDLLPLLDTLDGLGSKPATRDNADAYILALLNAYPRLSAALRAVLTPADGGEGEARAALARIERGCCSVKLPYYDNDAGTGTCARWAGHGDDPNDYGHSGWPDDENWEEHIHAALTLLDAERAKVAALTEQLARRDTP